MIKTKIIETTEKYDKDGNLVEKVTREETSEDNTDYSNGSEIELKSEDILKQLRDYQKRTGVAVFGW